MECRGNLGGVAAGPWQSILVPCTSRPPRLLRYACKDSGAFGEARLPRFACDDIPPATCFFLESKSPKDVLNLEFWSFEFA